MGSAFGDHNQTDGDLSDAQVLAAAHDLVSAFCGYLRKSRPGHDILDTRDLPAGKGSLINAFRLTVATEPRIGVRRKLVAAANTLAQFQDAVGSRIAVTPIQENGPVSFGAGGLAGKLDLAFVQISHDSELLDRLMSQAANIAARRFDESEPEVLLREDGTYTWHGHGTQRSARPFTSGC